MVRAVLGNVSKMKILVLVSAIVPQMTIQWKEFVHNVMNTLLVMVKTTLAMMGTNRNPMVFARMNVSSIH